MTIPMSVPFGRRLVFSMNLVRSSQPTGSSKFPEALDATDSELARLNRHAAAEADRRRWQAQAIAHGINA